jgi:hypothetical protein
MNLKEASVIHEEKKGDIMELVGTGRQRSRWEADY